ncbi:MAG: lysyl oxidase family protein, partial [Actinomycetota bacterium]|nr:lysyl oxidase family protein [Actinomycetota bacterium]
MPTRVDATQVAPVYVDAYSLPGRLLYRFDAVISNRGGTLDLWGNPAAGVVHQVVWRGGVPAQVPDPNYFAPHPAATVTDRTALGARLVYVTHGGHDHWHLLHAARYELVVPGGATRDSKAGFCLVDTYDVPAAQAFFVYGIVGVGPFTWCKAGEPGARFVRMGITAGVGDVYRSQLADQWVDVTGVAPGAYTLRATVNPLGYISETNTSNNVVSETRTVPGVRASPVRARAVSGRTSSFQLSATVIAPEIPARASAACQPTPAAHDCYLPATESGPLEFRLDTPPAHGSVELSAPQGRAVTASYTPEPGYSGSDGFTYVATDARRLTSPPARVELSVVPPVVCAVPRLTGMTLARARRSLRLANCRLGRV